MPRSLQRICAGLIAWPALAVFSSLLLVVLTTTACNFDTGHKSRNLVLIVIDTLRADHLGVYGYPRPTSTHIDKFAKDSIVFNARNRQELWIGMHDQAARSSLLSC